MFDVVCIGDAIVDIVALVERFPRLDEEVEISRLEFHPGGAAANSASCLSKLGLKVAFVGAVGSDYFGKLLLKAFEKDGVDTSRVKVVKTPTGVVIAIVLRRTGERVLFAFEGANTELKPSDIDFNYVLNCKAIQLNGTKLDVAVEVARMAKKQGLTVQYDPGSMYTAKGLETLRGVIENTDILMLNRAELSMLIPEEDLSSATFKLLELGPNIVVVKLGAEGCFVKTWEKEFRCPAYKVKPVDTTGAGDAFNSAFLYAILRGYSLEKAALFANATAALKITRVGARSLPRLSEVLEFLKKQGLKQLKTK